MALKEPVKKMWIELQKRSNVPVNAIGIKIEEKDAQALKVWRTEGIDKFLKSN
jgi:hypothetical protein